MDRSWASSGARASGGKFGVAYHTCSPLLSLPATELPLTLDLPPPPPLEVEDLGLPPPPPPGFGSDEPSWVPEAYLEKGT